ncbi:MAG: hypothetical protein HC769_18585 [Cyanobacteria bacterium CRU_2_1]|nr:hypothetical protein [Cyanobacteria bacterium CRU_2_1]
MKQLRHNFPTNRLSQPGIVNNYDPTPWLSGSFAIDNIRVFYDVDTELSLVKIEAIGYKEGNTLFIHGEEYDL